jgi:hypothetical protein
MRPFSLPPIHGILSLSQYDVLVFLCQRSTRGQEKIGAARSRRRGRGSDKTQFFKLIRYVFFHSFFRPLI